MAMQHSNTADAFTPQDFGGLVNLAVQAQCGVHHRLIGTGRQVDDREAPVPKGNRSVRIRSRVVRPAARQRFGHAFDHRQVR